MDAEATLSWQTLTIIFIVSITFAAIHLWSSQLHNWLYRYSQDKIICFTGGMAVAYVFCTLLPEVESIEAQLGGHYYVLGGFLVFYAFQRLGWNLETRFNSEGKYYFFLIEIIYKAIYSFLIVYALPEEFEAGRGGIFLYVIAMGLHILSDNYIISRNHGYLFHKWGRYFLVGGVACGFLTDVFAPSGLILADILLAALSGALIFNIFKEEVPEVGHVVSKDSHFNLFFLGAVVYLVLGIGSHLIEVSY